MVKRKDKPKYYLLGAVVVIAIGIILLVDLDDLGNIELLRGDGAFEFTMPPLASLIPPAERDGFDQITNIGTQVVSGAECKIKHTVTVFDNTGKITRVEESRGVIGNPQLQLNTLISDAGTPVGWYSIEPKIFCQVTGGESQGITIEQSTLQLRVGDSGRILVIKNLQTNTVQFINQQTCQILNPNNLQRCAEKSLGKIIVSANEIDSRLAQSDFTANLQFSVGGDIYTHFNDSFLSDIQLIFPINSSQMRANIPQQVLSSSELDSDKDGIIDKFDDCPTLKETFNSFNDEDGCPDIAPSDVATGTTIDTNIITEPLNEAQCLALGKTLYTSDTGALFCTFQRTTTSGAICGTFDATNRVCLNPMDDIFVNTIPEFTDPSGVTESQCNDLSDTEGFVGWTTINGVTGCYTTCTVNGDHIIGGCEGIEGSSTSNPVDITDLNSDQITQDILKGKTVTTITFDLPNPQEDTTILASSLGLSSSGSLDLSKLVPASLLVDEASETEEPATVNNIIIETFYVRDTLLEAQELKLTGSGLNYIASIDVSGKNVRLKDQFRQGSDVGQFGRDLGDGLYGFSLGKAIYSTGEIQQLAVQEIPNNTSQPITFISGGNGKISIQLQGESRQLTIQSETVRLANLVVSNNHTPTVTTGDGIGDDINGGCGEGLVLSSSGGKGSCVAGGLDLNAGVIVCQFLNNEIDPAPCNEQFRIDFCGDKDISTNCAVPEELKPSSGGTCAENVSGSSLAICTGDSDGDGKLDINDQCPFQKAFTPDGCPLKIANDPDNDGIPNEFDQCPNSPETYNGYQDTDGCPDVKPSSGTGGSGTGGSQPICIELNDGQIVCSGGTGGTPFPDIDQNTLMIIAVGILILGIVVVIAKRRS